MTISPYSAAASAITRHRSESNPHPQYVLVTDLTKQLAGKSNVGHTHPTTSVSQTVTVASGSTTVVIADVTGLQAALDAKAALSHTHPQSDVTNLVSDLAGKAASVHTHAQSDVTGLVTDLAGKVPTSRVVGGQDSIVIANGTDLSADVFLNLVGDDDTPGGNKVYGTNGAGVKGWKNDPSSSVNIKETEIDFGTTPVDGASFVITDSDVSAGSQLIGTVAYVAPTGKDLDELEMDGLDLKFAPGSGQFTLYARGLDGYIADKFKINYLIG